MIDICVILGTLRERLPQLQKFAWAESTKRTRDYQWRKYIKFCLRVKIQPIPMDCEMVSLFLLHLAMNGLAYSTINNQLSALVSYARLHRQDIALRMDFGIELTLLALQRILGDSPKGKEELYPGELIQVKKCVNLSSYVEESSWLGVLFLYRTMLRKSHVFSGEFGENLLCRKDLKFTEWGVIVTVRHTKTIQYRQRTLEIPLCMDDGPLCVIKLLRSYLKKYPARDTDPILCRVVGTKLEVINYTTALKLLKTWCLQAKVNKDIGMHSLRRGAATLMALAGFPLEDIKQRGDWKSMSVLQYLAYPMHQKINIDRKIGDFINNYV